MISGPTVYSVFDHGLAGISGADLWRVSASNFTVHVRRGMAE